MVQQVLVPAPLFVSCKNSSLGHLFGHMGEHIKMSPTCPGQLAPWESKGSCWSGGESCGTVQSWCTQVTPRSKFPPHFFPRALLGPVPVAAMRCGKAEGIFPRVREIRGDPKGCEGCGFGSGSVGCT